MKERLRVLVVFGTRPEAIKLAPVVLQLKERAGEFETLVAVTGQHREMLDSVLGVFGIAPDFDLDIMTAHQSLTDIALRAIAGLSPIIESSRPDVVVVQGDTTTTFAAALLAFYHGVKVAHVEAGLRTHDLTRPYPEEGNRRLTAQIAHWHFAPTPLAEENLLAEGVAPSNVIVTGNTVVDALLQTDRVRYEFAPGDIATALASGRRIVLVTAHRRENWGAPMGSICEATSRLAEKFGDVEVLFATHRNPICADVAREVLGGRERIRLIGPQDYLPFVKLLKASTLVLTDSGGIQEEATMLGKPTLVMRGVTERVEAIDAGVAKLVGTDADRIFEEASALLGDDAAYSAMANGADAFGDGHAAEKIVDVLARVRD